MPKSSEAVPGTNGYAAQYNNLRDDILQANSDVITVTVNPSTYNAPIDLAAKGKIYTIPLGANPVNLQIANYTVPRVVFIRLVQDATGGRTVGSWFTGLTGKMPGGVAPALSTAPNAIDGFMLVFTSATTYELYFGGFGLT